MDLLASARSDSSKFTHEKLAWQRSQAGLLRNQELGSLGMQYAASIRRGLITPRSRYYKKITSRAALIIPGTFDAAAPRTTP